MGKAARATVEERNWEHSIGRVRQVYAEAIKEGRNTAMAPTWQQRLAEVRQGDARRARCKRERCLLALVHEALTGERFGA